MRATGKPFDIEKKRVYEAYKAVKSNGGAAGVDGQTIEQFEADLKGNLYKIWNRMSSGTYFPPPVRAVSIPECHLELHPTKTKIVYCRDGKRKGTYPNVKFDFLGYCFRPRWIKKSRDNSMFCGFNPAVSPSALKTMRSTIRDLNIRRQTQLSLADIARTLNPLLRGWIEYYGRYAPSALSPMLRYVNQTLVRWAMRKFKRFKAHKIRASRFLQKLVREKVSLFVHWRIGMIGAFA